MRRILPWKEATLKMELLRSASKSAYSEHFSIISLMFMRVMPDVGTGQFLM